MKTLTYEQWLQSKTDTQLLELLLSHIDPDSVEEAFKQEYDIETHKTT